MEGSSLWMGITIDSRAMESISLTPADAMPCCATMRLAPATSPTTPEPGFHALALARASGAFHSGSVPVFRCDADRSADAGGVPPVFRRAPDGTGLAGGVGAHHQHSRSRRDCAEPGGDAEHRGVSRGRKLRADGGGSAPRVHRADRAR